MERPTGARDSKPEHASTSGWRLIRHVGEQGPDVNSGESSPGISGRAAALLL
jgi:hypothetical protein